MSEKELELEDLDNLVIMEDQDGNELEFEISAVIPYEGKQYVVLLPLDEDNEDTVIFELREDEDEDCEPYLGVEDEEVLQAVYKIFLETVREELNRK